MIGDGSVLSNNAASLLLFIGTQFLVHFGALRGVEYKLGEQLDCVGTSESTNGINILVIANLQRVACNVVKTYEDLLDNNSAFRDVTAILVMPKASDSR